MKEEFTLDFSNTEVAYKHKSNKELKTSIFLFSTMKYSWLIKWGPVLMEFALKFKFPIIPLIKNTLFQQFCGGETIEESKKTIDKLNIYNVKTILDFSAEGLKNEDGFEQSKKEILKTVNFSGTTPEIPFSVLKMSALADTDLLAKAQNKDTLTPQEKENVQRAFVRLDEIIEVVNQKKLKLMVDAEESWFQNYVDEHIVRQMKKYNKEEAVIYITYQLYRKDTYQRLVENVQMARKNGYKIGVKLVRGAYVDKERERAKWKGYESPIHNRNIDVNNDYDKAVNFCIENIDVVRLCAGTHNTVSTNVLVALMRENNMDSKDARIYFSQLLGMSDNLTFVLAKEGYNVAKYVPYGPVKKVLPYLFRRAEENSSISGQVGREYLLQRGELLRRQKNKN